MHRTSGMRLSPGLHFRRSLCLSGPAGPGALPTFFPGGALPGGVPAPSPTPELLRASNPALRQRLSRSAAVFAAFVSPAEGAAVLREAEEALRRRRYEDGHWDGAISGFREAERSRWGALSGAVLQRISSAFPPARPPLPHSHILDLAPHGCVRPHIDSTKFCGCTIAGLSLLSAAVMRLRSVGDPQEWAELLLEPLSLYVLRGEARYGFTHEVLGGEESFFGALRVPRQRRLAVICRNAPPHDTPWTPDGSAAFMGC